LKGAIENGACPGCRGAGRTGTPCGETLCAARGYHRIPVDYLGPAGEIPDLMMGQLLGIYLIVGGIGSGAFGTVYLGLQLPVGLKAAVKMLDLRNFPRQMWDTLLEKFESEARALAAVQHPNVLRLFQYSTVRGQPYIVTDYIDGGFTLEEEIEQRAATDEGYRVEEVAAMLDQILSGLNAVHDAGIAHRDIKPANIMIQDRAGYPRLVRILDFGLAKFLERGDVTLATSGTPDYMAPEQLTRDRLGPWTDLYAVGVIAYELLSGCKPFPGDDIQTVLFHKLNPSWDPNERVRQLGLPEQVQAFFARSLAMDPGDRYRSVGEMREGLESALARMDPGGAGVVGTISVDGLVRSPGSNSENSTMAIPLMVVRSDETVDSEEAFRRWIEMEANRLGSEDSET